MLINVLVNICGMVLLLSTFFAFILWLGNKHKLLKFLLFSWLSGIGSFILQGVFNNMEITGLLAFSINWITVVFFLKIYSIAAEIQLPYTKYNVFVFFSVLLGLLVMINGGDYRLASGLFCAAVAGSIIHAATKKNQNKDIITFGYRVLLIGDALHFLDYPFVRPTPELAIIGFSVTLIFFFCFAVYVPTFILRKISIDYNKDLRREVEVRTFQLKETNNQLTIAFENLRSKSQELDEILKDNQSRLSMLVHDISTPLTLLVYNINSLISNPAAYFEQIGKKADKLKSATKAMEHILKESRQVHAVKLGKNNVSLQEVSMDSIVREVLDLYEEKLTQKNISVEYSKEELLACKVLANDSWLKDHVLSNLISNAIKFSYAGGVIKIRAVISEDQKFVNLYVQDSGVGISLDKQKKIFDLNVATTSSGTSGESGTGLGLPIVKQYTELMGGKIKVVDNKLAKGTCFELTLSKAA